MLHRRRTGRGTGALASPPTFFADGNFFYMRTPGIPNQKSQADARHAANIAFDLFNIFLYVITRKVRKCPLSPFVTSNVVLSCLVRMADILARLAQKANSLSALQLTGALWYSLSNTPTPPSIPAPSLRPPLLHFLDRPAATVLCRVVEASCVKPCQVKPCQVKLCRVKSIQAISSQAKPSYIDTGRLVLKRTVFLRVRVR